MAHWLGDHAVKIVIGAVIIAVLTGIGYTALVVIKVPPTLEDHGKQIKEIKKILNSILTRLDKVEIIDIDPTIWNDLLSKKKLEWLRLQEENIGTDTEIIDPRTPLTLREKLFKWFGGRKKPKETKGTVAIDKHEKDTDTIPQ